MRRAVLILFLLIQAVLSIAQTRVTDSLRKELYQLPPGLSRLPVLLALGKEQQSLNRDSAYEYAITAKSLAQQQSNREKSLAALYLSQSYLPWGWVDSALAALEPVLSLNRVEDPATRDLYFQLYRQKAMLYGAHIRYREALDILYRLVTEATKYRDTLALGANLNTIGSIAIARQEFREAPGWLYKALAVSTGDERYLPVLTAIYINLADISVKLNKADSSLYYLEKALPLARKLDNLYILASALRVRIDACARSGLLGEAEKSFKELQTVNGKAQRFNVSDENLAMADFYISTSQVDKAIRFCKAQLEPRPGIAGSDGQTFISSPEIRLLFLQRLAKCYSLNGQGDDYRQTLEQIITVKDSVFARASAKEIADIQAKYEAQLRESAIIERQRLDIVRGNYLVYGLSVLFVVAVVAGTLIFYTNRKRQRLKTELMVKEEKRLAEEAIRDAQEKERRRIAADLHDNLGVWAASMASNINYLVIDEKNELVRNAFAEIKASAGSMVSELNDTIWVLKRESLSLTAISDRIKVFINRLRKSYPAVIIDIVEDIPTDNEFSASRAFHLYRIIQEAISNALKHSSATEIIISIQGGDNWKVSVSDNGTGFVLSGISTEGGNGLANMQERARENGWMITWKSNAGTGTLVEIGGTAN